MARILADREIRRFLGTVLVDSEEKLLNPNGIELRLGKHVVFHSTGEEAELISEQYLKVNPGETVTISSLELIDFTPETVQKILPGRMLMGFITPTTTMMREGISQVSTKIDAGFRGNLNWGLRNGSTKDLLLQYGEPIFKLTVFELEENEVPEIPYGERAGDSYQDTKGIRRSARRIAADIPKSKIVSSSFGKLDPKRQLHEAGYPFDHIGTELVALDGKFEVVSKDVRLMRDEFQRRATELSEKIQSETKNLSIKMDDERKTLLEKVESLFDRKFLKILGIIIGAIPIMYGGVTFLQGCGFKDNTVSFIAVIAGVIALLVTYSLTKKK